jgi:LacI family transcriptional regulator
MVKRPTIADVARLAGTSTAVVSYALNPGTRPVSDTLRQQVLRAVEELGYRPDRNARALRNRQGWGQIGLIVPDVTLPLYGALVGHLERAGRARQHLVITGSTGFDPAVEVELVNGLLDAGVDGLVAASVSDGRAVSRLADQARIPLTWVHNTRHLAGRPLVGSDHASAGRVAAEHLLRVHQRTNVAFVGGFTEQEAPTGDREAVRERYSGYAAVYGARSLQVKTDLTLAGTYQAVRDFLEQAPEIDGLVIGTYSQSPAALRALLDANRQVPTVVATVTFDGDPRNSYAPVVLSTVQQNVDLIARQALELTLGSTVVSPPPIPVFFNTGESCGCQSRSR